MESVLNQAFEESRYHRKFHHTVFILAVTLYSGLLAIQLVSPIVLNDGFVKTFMAIGVGIVLPLYFSYLIITYHVTISELNSIVYHLGKAMMDSPEYAIVIQQNSQPLNINNFLFKKYADALSDNRDLKFVGRGHWFFIGVVVLLVVMNAVMFYR